MEKREQKHPAKYSKVLFPVIAGMLDGDESVLDPMGGVGGVFSLLDLLPNLSISCVEIETEWVDSDPRITLGSVLNLPWADSTFDAIVVSPPYGNRMCLSADTLVLTRDAGYVPIEQVRVDDLVLTHTGSWKSVLWAGQTGNEPVCEIVAQGPGVLRATVNHVLPLKHNDSTWGKVALSEKEWRSVSTIDPLRDHLCIARNVSEQPVPKPPIGDGAEVWWAVGFYLGNGWGYHSTRKSGSWMRSTVMFCKDKTLAPACEAKLKEAFGDRLKKVKPSKKEENLTKWAVYSQDLLRWLLDNFGKGSSQKRVPGWVLNLNTECRTALIDGWLSADGCLVDGEGATRNVGVSVNKPMIRMMQTLAHSVGYSTSFSQSKHAKIEQVVGTDCQVKDAWSLRVRPEKTKRIHRDEDGDWTVIRSVRSTGVCRPVYDIAVEGDCSFVADGVIVHNSDHHVAKDVSVRHTYRHYLGHALNEDNAGGYQWGDQYKTFHMLAWAESLRVLKQGGKFILNCKNHIRKGEVQYVVEWHIGELVRQGFCLRKTVAINTPGQRNGKNWQLRIDHEIVALFTKR